MQRRREMRLGRWLSSASACLIPLLFAAGAGGEAPRWVKPHSLHTTEQHVFGDLSTGETAELTLDPELQQTAHQLLARARPLAGAALLLDVRTGELRVLSNYRRAGAPPGDPVTTAVPAASVFKLITTTALLERTSVNPTTRVCFDGGERRIERNHLQAPSGAHARCGTFGTALGHSRNAVYAQLATEHLMRRDLLEVADRIGFNHPLPFDLPATVGTLELPYNDLAFARAAAGFQGSLLTPLGALHLTYAIANRGQARRMRLIQLEDRPTDGGQQIMSANTAWRLTRMMEVTVHSGTSLAAFSNEQGTSYLGDIRVAGKTGTLKPGKSAPTTSWFTGFAPSRKPEVAVTVMLQNGKVWRQRANQVARDLLRAVFAGRRGVSHPLKAE